MVEDISKNVEDEIDLESIVKDMGAVLVHPETDKTAKLAIKVSEYSRLGASINFDSVELIGKSDEYTYSVIGDSAISYILYGMDTTFETLDRSKMEFSLDVTGLEPGIHTVNLQMTANQKVSLASEVPVKIKIDSQ